MVVGTVDNRWTSQRFLPGSGWLNAVAIFPESMDARFRVQRMNVSGVPYMFHRDLRYWYRSYFDCSGSTWVTSPAFPVEFRSTEVSGERIPIEVGFSETYDHNVLAAAIAAPDQISLSEFVNGIWSPATKLGALAFVPNGSSVSSRIANMTGIAVVRAKDADIALVNYGAAVQYMAAHVVGSADFLPISPTRSCLGHFCVGYPLYNPPRLEQDGSATVLLNSAPTTTANDWYRAGVGGLTSLWGKSAPYAFDDPLQRVVRADGVAQWLTFSFPNSLGHPTVKGDIFEDGQAADWSNTFSFELSGCYSLSCRALSVPDTSHLVTVMNAGVTPLRTPYLSISDRIGKDSWVGSYSAPLGQLWVDGPNANGSGPAGSGNGTIALVHYLADTRTQMVVATLDSTRLDSGIRDITPFVLWK